MADIFTDLSREPDGSAGANPYESGGADQDTDDFTEVSDG